MQIVRYLLLLTALIDLTACSSMAGNVVPKSGPPMEHVYDSMGKENAVHKSISNQKNRNDKNSLDGEQQASAESDMLALRQQVRSTNSINYSGTPLSQINRYAVSQEFHKLPNPELHLYVFPHLAGSDQVPVPGYYTVFSAYERDHYALPQEMKRG